MALQVEPVGRVKVRFARSLATTQKGMTAGQLFAYVLSALAGILVGFHVTGPIVAGLIFGR